MRSWISGRRQRLHVVLAGAFVLTMAWGIGGACAQNAQDDDEPFDAKFWQGMMRELGLQRDEGPIEYRERAPLVVPPSRNLPAPRGDTPAAANPAWPNDPDVKRRREATATPSQKARLRGDKLMEDLRPMRPDELARGRSNGDGGAGSSDDPSRVMSPSELGSKQGLWGMITSSIGPERPESMPFQGEAPRMSLTAPPTGYQTPSPAQPYGVMPASPNNKPATLEDRTPALPR